VLLGVQDVRLEAFQSDYSLSPHNSCRAWPLLPVLTLDLYSATFGHAFVTPRVLQQIAKLTRLTELYINMSDESTGSVKDLGLALQPLQQLRDLHMTGCRNLRPPAPPTSEPGQLNDSASAVGGMRQLTSLHLGGLDFTQASVERLQQLCQLERLTLCDCGIDN
jgi:hypothetical protein